MENKEASSGTELAGFHSAIPSVQANVSAAIIRCAIPCRISACSIGPTLCPLMTKKNFLACDGIGGGVICPAGAAPIMFCAICPIICPI